MVQEKSLNDLILKIQEEMSNKDEVNGTFEIINFSFVHRSGQGVAGIYNSLGITATFLRVYEDLNKANYNSINDFWSFFGDSLKPYVVEYSGDNFIVKKSPTTIRIPVPFPKDTSAPEYLRRKAKYDAEVKGINIRVG